jgi:hypothetical protein
LKVSILQFMSVEQREQAGSEREQPVAKRAGVIESLGGMAGRLDAADSRVRN